MRHARFARFAQRARTWAQSSGMGSKAIPRARGPRVDYDATNATLAALCGSLASLQEVVLDFLNEQTVTAQGGDGEVVIAWAAVARDGGRNAGKDMAP